MVVSIAKFRIDDDHFDPDIVYRDYPNFFSMKIHHGGHFTSKFPGRSYTNGRFQFVDLIDSDLFSVLDLKEMVDNLGYDREEIRYYHFKIPNSDLDYGLQALGNDDDACSMNRYVGRYKVLEVYVEHNITSLDTYDRSPQKLIIEDNENLNEENDDSDFIVDVENNVNEVEVDMETFNLNIDKDVEWVGSNLTDNVQVPDNNSYAIGLDLDDFESVSDSENEGARKKALRKIRKQHAKKGNMDKNSPFHDAKDFGSKDEIKELVYKHAVESRRQLFISKNDKYRIRVICRGNCPVFSGANDKWVKESPNKGKEVVGEKKGKRIYKKEVITCPWVLHISRGKKEETWTTKTYMDVHNCLQTRKVNMCTNTFLSKDIEEVLKSNPEVPLKSLKEQVQMKNSVGVSVDKVFRAKAKATLKVKGDYEEQYHLLRDYVLELQSSNLDTTVRIDVETYNNVTDTTRQFKRIYVCIGALKNGFRAGLRDLLGVDGCHMKGPFPGQLLSAVGIDPNHGTYPLAYGLVEAETNSAWTWFLKCLGDDLGLDINSYFTFISDRQKGLVPSIAKVFPCAEHRFCVRHIHDNMKPQWSGKVYKDHLWECASATTIQYFEKAMDKLKKKNQAAYEWLKAIPPQHWSKSHFSGRAHCDILLNNICEVFNRQLLDGRDVPIITCLEFVREYLMRRIVNVQKVIDKTNGPLTPSATTLFDAIKEEANKYKVYWNSAHQYQVMGPFNSQYVVDMSNKSCTCRKWELTGMPCKHAVATIWDMQMNDETIGSVESYVHPVYWLSTWKEVYKNKVNPINGRDMWVKSICPTVITPPKHHTQPGRPKKKRNRSAGELSERMVKGGKLSRKGKTVTCDKCKNTGHNQRSCNRQVDGASVNVSQAGNQGGS